MKEKCEVLHLRRNNPKYHYTLGGNQLKNCLAENYPCRGSLKWWTRTSRYEERLRELETYRTEKRKLREEFVFEELKIEQNTAEVILIEKKVTEKIAFLRFWVAHSVIQSRRQMTFLTDKRVFLKDA